MRLSFLLSLLCVSALATSASAQSFFGKKPAATAGAVPAVTVTKPGSAPAAAAADSDVRARGRAVAGSVTAPEAPSSGSNATFRPGDALDMRVSGVPNEDASAFPTPITIGSDGFVNITYVGQIRAAGLTPAQLERAIEKKFVDDKYFRKPTVTINIMNQARFVTIGGNVRAPNRYGWSADLTLMTAIATAGGPNDYGGDKINLIRDGTVTLYRYKALKKKPSDDPKLFPGDQVDFL